VIRVQVSARLSQGDRPPSGNAVEESIQQCAADAVEGSFGEYPEHMRELVRFRAELLDEPTMTHQDTFSEVQFTLGLPQQIFPIDRGGLQLLVSVLAGDLFPSEVSGCQWSSVTVRNLELPTDLQEQAMRRFRSNAHDIGSIRAAFRLAQDRPLLAFSLKPRVGPTFDEIRTLTLAVLKEGFNIVELDTRSLALASAPLDKWIELGQEAAETGRHMTAFSPNFTLPAPQLVDVAARWVEELAGHGPAVFKVDGGLDALTNLQSVRTTLTGSRTPIVTSYPLLHRHLAPAIGQGTWTNLLALSGADIVYPGGRPTFPNERRPVWGSHAKDWLRAARVYDAMTNRGWPMPTIAGGVHPGHLHAFYELLGPNTAYFLGGAVALHPRSVKEGAKLCVAVLEKAIDLAEDARRSGRRHARDLPTRLLNDVERFEYPTPLSYFPPENIFGLSDEVSPRPFYRRPA
jgi:ribulose 1,5-bisphosphate carboxylase large subunit-like protein